MKTWEKILLYPIGLCLWLGDQAKKAGKLIERNTKPAIAMLVAVTVKMPPPPVFWMKKFFSILKTEGICRHKSGQFMLWF